MEFDTALVLPHTPAQYSYLPVPHPHPGSLPTCSPHYSTLSAFYCPDPFPSPPLPPDHRCTTYSETECCGLFVATDTYSSPPRWWGLGRLHPASLLASSAGGRTFFLSCHPLEQKEGISAQDRSLWVANQTHARIRDAQMEKQMQELVGYVENDRAHFIMFSFLIFITGPVVF